MARAIAAIFRDRVDFIERAAQSLGTASFVDNARLGEQMQALAVAAAAEGSDMVARYSYSLLSSSSSVGSRSRFSSVESDMKVADHLTPYLWTAHEGQVVMLPSEEGRT
jgi:hypothetical protein